MPDSVKLKFPDISPRLKVEQGQKYIWDALRGKWLVLTPEEWVRRHVVSWLVEHKGVPALRISQEYPVNINGQHQRADVVVVDEFARPKILVECKAADVAINEDVVMQAVRYNNVVGAQFMVLTNGLRLFCYECVDGKYRALRDIL